jgi:hypothetical protein
VTQLTSRSPSLPSPAPPRANPPRLALALLELLPCTLPAPSATGPGARATVRGFKWSIRRPVDRALRVGRIRGIRVMILGSWAVVAATAAAPGGQYIAPSGAGPSALGPRNGSHVGPRQGGVGSGSGGWWSKVKINIWPIPDWPG